MIELNVNKPVHWFTCQLHANELPLRHLSQTLDGKTTGPQGYSGEIGKMLDGCEKLDVVNFEPNPYDLPDMNQSNPSTDQQYLYDNHKSVSAGKSIEGLANKSPGKMAHSRWLTDQPSRTLRIIVAYIMKVYALVWFAIKKCFIFSKWGSSSI